MIRSILVIACLSGIGWSTVLILADNSFRQDTAESVRMAIRLVPDEPAYHLRLAQLDPASGEQSLATALRLNPYSASAAIELALMLEYRGDRTRAEKLLLQAFDVDRSYLPRWSLANFYFRTGDLPAFWNWARKAADMPSDDIGALLDLCWRLNPNPEFIATHVVTDDPSTLHQFLAYLLRKQSILTTPGIVTRLVKHGAPETDRKLALSVVNALVAVGDAEDSQAVWRSLLDNGWVVGDSTRPNNPAFARPPLPVAFDWTFPSYDGISSLPGPSGLIVQFSGQQPESCTLAEQIVPLSPGSYRLLFTYQTRDIAPDTGLRWILSDARSGRPFASTADLSSPSSSDGSLSFVVPQGSRLSRLQLRYKRALGTARISGTATVLRTELRSE